MVKILYILTKSGIGGAQKYTVDLSKKLDKNKFEAKIVYGGSEAHWLSNKTYPWFLFLNDWLAVFELVKIFRKERPNIVHLNSSKAGVIGAIAVKIYKLIYGHPMSRILNAQNFRTSDVPKVVFTAHGWVFNPTNEISWLARQFYVFLHKISAKFQDKIICVSEHDYNLSLEYDICDPEKLTTIHNGIDANIKFLNKKEARADLKLKLILGHPMSQKSHASSDIGCLKNNKWPWIGSIGRLVTEKNYETFIGAAKLVKNAYFFIIGEGPELEKLKVLSYKLKVNDRFFFVEPTGNDAQYLKAFDVFAMSSIKEGLPYILLEAMAAELPIVITEAGGMPELIKNHENGLMVSQKNPEALARAIGGLIENQAIAKELAKKTRETVAEKFSLEKMVNRTEREYLALSNATN